MAVTLEICVDNFAGGGGASTGIEAALGVHVTAARRQAVDVLECLEQYYGAAHVLQMQPPEEVAP